MFNLSAIVRYTDEISVRQFIDDATGKTNARVFFNDEPLPEVYEVTFDAMQAAKALKKKQQPGEPEPQNDSENI